MEHLIMWIKMISRFITQLVEYKIMVLVVTGSIPVKTPNAFKVLREKVS